MEYSNIATPERCYVDFCLIPVSSIKIYTPLLLFDQTKELAQFTHDIHIRLALELFR